MDAVAGRPSPYLDKLDRESTIDIMAAKLKVDPLEFRLRNTTNARSRGVLEAAAKAFGWKAGAGPSGQGRAIALSIDAGTHWVITI